MTGCPNRHHARGWCRVHYARFLRHGDPTTVLEHSRKVPLPSFVRDSVGYVPLTHGLYAKVDPEDLPRVSQFNWHRSVPSKKLRHVYAYRKATGKKTGTISMHRDLMGAPPGMYVDHINGDTLDNRRSNLRIVTPQENCQNTRARSCPFCGRVTQRNHSDYGKVSPWHVPTPAESQTP